MIFYQKFFVIILVGIVMLFSFNDTVLAASNELSLDTVKNSKVMQEQWQAYQKNFEYAKDVDFGDVCDVVVRIMDEMNEER
ncbi:hypothetical protein [Dialister hominis]|uniref:hypothetical protein n=1 Tax=Dialister hominis TaxID=2582419 RepID=UPI004025D151